MAWAGLSMVPVANFGSAGAINRSDSRPPGPVHEIGVRTVDQVSRLASFLSLTQPPPHHHRAQLKPWTDCSSWSSPWMQLSGYARTDYHCVGWRTQRSPADETSVLWNTLVDRLGVMEWWRHESSNTHWLVCAAA